MWTNITEGKTSRKTRGKTFWETGRPVERPEDLRNYKKNDDNVSLGAFVVESRSCDSEYLSIVLVSCCERWQ